METKQHNLKGAGKQPETPAIHYYLPLRPKAAPSPPAAPGPNRVTVSSCGALDMGTVHAHLRQGTARHHLPPTTGPCGSS